VRLWCRSHQLIGLLECFWPLIELDKQDQLVQRILTDVERAKPNFREICLRTLLAVDHAVDRRQKLADWKFPEHFFIFSVYLFRLDGFLCVAIHVLLP
jgi:hypothetical protein